MLRSIGIRQRFRIVWSVVLLLVSPWITHFARAAEDCAGTPQAIIQFLNKAETQSTPYKIKVLAGTYNLTGANYLWIVPTSLTLEGGYVDCNTRGSGAASATVIDASALFPGFHLLSTEGTLKIDGFTIVGGATTSFEGGEISGSGNLALTHTRITQSQAVLTVVDGTLTLDGVLIDRPPIDTLSHCSARIDLYGDNAATLKFVTLQTSATDNVCVESDGHQNTVKAYNSILWPGSVWMDAASWQQGDVFDLKFVNSLFSQVIVPQGTSSEEASLHVDPLWENPAAGDFTLQSPPSPMSPAINVGAGGPEVPGGISDTDTDIGGNPRVVGGIPDMGAYESAVDDGAVFLVTNTTDCSTPLNQPSCGSLRDAVARAVSPISTAPVKTVEFAIKDPANQPLCPATIQLNSGLPDITTHVVIDGYTQGGIDQSNPPLSWTNTDPYTFNASLCVHILGPGSDYALRVPSGSSGSLTLRGVALGGFSQGVMLLGGANHQIVGNEFGGIPHGFGYYGFSSAAVHVDTAAPVIIGGSNPADRNVFLNAFSPDNSNAAGTIVGYSANGTPGSCQIVGNLYGVPSDGQPAYLGNENGLLIQGGGCNVLGNHFAGNTKDAILLMGGSHNVIQYNLIGPSRFFGADFYNPGAGIRVTNGANDNVIGGGDGFVGQIYDYQNIITDMDAGGIVVSNSTGNAIRGNAIYGNGLTTNLNIDLGGDGPTPNDPGDADGTNGANDLMNYPVPHAVAWDAGAPPQPGSVALTIYGDIDVPVGNYEIDAYYDLGCSPTGRGGGSWVGEQFYTQYFPGRGAFSVLTYIPIFGYDSTNGRLSLTVTSIDTGAHHSTSEFSQCLSVDTIFSSGFEQ